MADFQELRRQLEQLRGDKAAAEDRLSAAREALQQSASQLTQLNRTGDRNSPAYAQERQRLDEQQARHAQTLSRAQAERDRLRAAEGGLLGTYVDVSDPRRAIAQLNDAFPFLLMPVRLETRFKATVVDGVSRHQLWVRVYPDDCFIDTFEPTLTIDEIKNAEAYWASVWAAGGSEADERGAWRSLVASHGTGRALWIVRNYAPSNDAERPHRTSDSDVILVTPAVPAGDRDAAAGFWKAVWIAEDNGAQVQAARSALFAAVGDARADALSNIAPFNFTTRPAAGMDRESVAVTVAFIEFPDHELSREQSWSRAPKANILPDRFVLIAYRQGQDALVQLGLPIPSPLIVGPDPYAAPADQLQQNGDDITIPNDMEWMVDFDVAVKHGMGFRLDLTVDQARAGFDRLVVLGLRLSMDEKQGQAALEDLLRHHHFGRSGFGVLRQGTPTNNTEDRDSGYTRAEDSDSSFARRAADPVFTRSADWLERRDGQWLAESLGIDPQRLVSVDNFTGRDGIEARAMNIALWPGTFGYWMKTMMAPVFSPAAEDLTRSFFTRLVTGRGMVPAVRIGKQPYGLLPATAFSRMEWTKHVEGDRAIFDKATMGLLARLSAILQVVRADWAAMSQQASYAGKPGDAHKILLDVLGLHSGSVEYAQRYAESLDDLYNRLNLGGVGGILVAAVEAAGLLAPGRTPLQRLGYSGATPPDIMNRFFFGAHQPLLGPLIDDRPLSESVGIRSYTGDKRNYIQWLADAARSSLDTVRQQRGFTDEAPPKALLYILLRYAIEQGFYDTAIRLNDAVGVLSTEELQQARREAPFIHVDHAAPRSESRYAMLFTTEPRITGSENVLVADYIASNIGRVAASRHLGEQIRALDAMTGSTTAALERALSEHIDCCSYRLDAWLLGLVQYQLAGMRKIASDAEAEPARGIYLGAFGWVENLRPENRVLTPVQLPPELRRTFEAGGTLDPLLSDSANGGYIHAPSLNHAVTAAVLRSGYIANASTDNARTMAVNLTSERVRAAQVVLEGIREGQTLGALLGYQLETGLHDRYTLAEVDRFIYPLRKVFPLVADSIATTETDTDVPIESIEARNVLDGLLLVEHVRNTGDTAYPFGKDLPAASATERAAIDAEVQRLIETHDSLADLALAEGVHQAVQGNYDRVAATLDAFGQGGLPPEPSVVSTPDSGFGLTLRFALHLEAGLDPTTSPIAGIGMTPRASAEPALNAWLLNMLPPLHQIGCRVDYFDASAGAARQRAVTMSELGLQPIDLVFVIQPGNESAMAELDDRIQRVVTDGESLRPDSPLTIRYMDSGPAAFSIFQVLPLIRSLRRLTMSSRPLRPTDLAISLEGKSSADESVSADIARISVGRVSLQSLRADADAFVSDLSGLVNNLPARHADLVVGIDTFIARLAALLERASLFSIAPSSWGFAYDWRRRQFAAIVEKTAALLMRWSRRLADFDAALAAYDALPAATTDGDRFAALAGAEVLVSTTPASPRPDTAAAYRALLDGKRSAFASRLAAFEALTTTNRTALSDLFADVMALLPVSAFDTEALDFPAEAAAIDTFGGDILAIGNGIAVEATRRLGAIDAAVAEHDAAASASAKVAALTAAARAMLGDAALFLPEFTLGASADEIALAWNLSKSGALFQHLRDNEGVDFPADEWLHGVSRVRSKVQAWENVLLNAGAFDIVEPELTALQLPHDDTNQWLALPFPASASLNTETLLYTAHFAVPFVKGQKQCGLLLDEWHEVIPAEKITTGLTFNYDRPSNEPPQAMLLVTPTDFRGAWQWADVLDAVNETLDLAKIRAVEPAWVDASPYAQFLPATIMAATYHALTISANLAANNAIFATENT